MKKEIKNIRIEVQYDGRRYRGWQRQASTESTIQSKIEKVLMKMKGSPIEVNGAGRTDAGVHARAQVANFHLTTNMDTEAIRMYLNQYLPQDIRITKACEAGKRFHSRLNARAKTYVYTLTKAGCVDVFSREYSWQLERGVSVNQMRQAALLLIGTHDFSAFCTKAGKKKSTIRTLDRIDIEEDEVHIRMKYHGNGFLYNMVRILTGTLVEAGMGKCKPEQVIQALESGERRLAGETAPAHGLMLWEVEYD